MVVDLGEDDARAVAGPHRLADADRRHGLDILPGRQIADSKLEPLRAVIIGKRGQQLPVSADLERAEPEIMIAVRLRRLVEDRLIVTTADGLAIPAPVLRPRLERPPVEEIAVSDRDRAFVLLDPSLHLPEQLLEQVLLLPRPGLEISILGVEVGEHVGVIDLRIFGIAQPVPGVLDGHPVAFVAVGALFGGGRGGETCGLVHAALLTRWARTGRPKRRRYPPWVEGGH